MDAPPYAVAVPDPPRWRTTVVMAVVVVAVAAWQAVQAQQERAQRLRDWCEVKALIEWGAMRCDSR